MIAWVLDLSQGRKGHRLWVISGTYVLIRAIISAAVMSIYTYVTGLKYWRLIFGISSNVLVGNGNVKLHYVAIDNTKLNGYLCILKDFYVSFVLLYKHVYCPLDTFEAAYQGHTDEWV